MPRRMVVNRHPSARGVERHYRRFMRLDSRHQKELYLRIVLGKNPNMAAELAKRIHLEEPCD